MIEELKSDSNYTQEKYKDFDELAEHHEVMKKQNPFNLSLTQNYLKDGVNLYDVKTAIDGSMIESLI